MHRAGRSTWGVVGVYAFLVVAAAIAVFPLLWVVLSSFKTSHELAQSPLQLLPGSPTLEH